MRMTIDKLVNYSGDDINHIEFPAFLLDNRMEYHLKQQISQLLLKSGNILAVYCVENLIALFDK